MNFLIIFIVLPTVLLLLFSSYSLRTYLRHKEKQRKIELNTDLQRIRQEQKFQRWQHLIQVKANDKCIQQENHKKRQQRKDIKVAVRNAKREEKCQEQKYRRERKDGHKRIQQANKEQEKQERKNARTARKSTRQESGSDHTLTQSNAKSITRILIRVTRALDRVVRKDGSGLMLLGKLEAAIDISVNLGFVIPVVGEGGVDLAEREVGILEMKFGRTPAIGEMGGDEFDHFHGASSDVGNVIFADRDVFVFGGFDCEFYHGFTSR